MKQCIYILFIAFFLSLVSCSNKPVETTFTENPELNGSIRSVNVVNISNIEPAIRLAVTDIANWQPLNDANPQYEHLGLQVDIIEKTRISEITMSFLNGEIDAFGCSISEYSEMYDEIIISGIQPVMICVVKRSSVNEDDVFGIVFNRGFVNNNYSIVAHFIAVLIDECGKNDAPQTGYELLGYTENFEYFGLETNLITGNVDRMTMPINEIFNKQRSEINRDLSTQPIDGFVLYALRRRPFLPLPEMPEWRNVSESVQVYTDENLTLFVEAVVYDDGELIYQWFDAETNESVTDEIRSSLGVQLEVDTIETGLFYFYAVVTNPDIDTDRGLDAQTRTELISVKVNPITDIDIEIEEQPPENLELRRGLFSHTLVVTVRVNGWGDNYELSYQWFDATDGMPGSPIQGETANTLEIDLNNEAAYVYYLRVTATVEYRGTMISTVTETIPTNVTVSDETGERLDDEAVLIFFNAWSVRANQPMENGFRFYTGREDEMEQRIIDFCELINETPNVLCVIIEGHYNDEYGNIGHVRNQELMLGRANAIRDIMLETGVSIQIQTTENNSQEFQIPRNENRQWEDLDTRERERFRQSATIFIYVMNDDGVE